MNLSDSITITVLSATFWLIGLIAGIYYNIDIGITLLSFSSTLNLVFASLAVFILSAMFFGYLSPILFMIYGVINAKIFAMEGFNSLFYIGPLILAAYAGAILGTALKKEIDGKDNVLDYKKSIALWMGFSIILAILVTLIPPFVAPIG